MSKKQVYQIKVRVKHINPKIKVRPPFLQGIVIAESLRGAEDGVVNKMNELNDDPDLIYEKFKIVKLKTDFIQSL